LAIKLTVLSSGCLSGARNCLIPCHAMGGLMLGALCWQDAVRDFDHRAIDGGQ
jgi:hypothetical protein